MGSDDVSVSAAATEPVEDDPDLLEFWGRFPLATTLYLRERFRQYREEPGR